MTDDQPRHAAASNDTWLSVTSGAAGTGNGVDWAQIAAAVKPA